MVSLFGREKSYYFEIDNQSKLAASSFAGLREITFLTTRFLIA